MSTSTYNYLLTAAHCTGWDNYKTFKTGDNVKTIGENSWTDLLFGNKSLDATIIHSGERTPLIYYGAYDTNVTISIDGAKPWAQSISGCLSGSVSGTRCNVKRDGTATQLGKLCSDPTSCEWRYAFYVEAASVPNSQIVAGGDSGAPWYQHLSTGQDALGIQSGAPGTSEVPCGSNVDPSVTVKCYSRASVTPINRILDALDSYGIDVTTSF